MNRQYSIVSLLLLVSSCSVIPSTAFRTPALSFHSNHQRSVVITSSASTADQETITTVKNVVMTTDGAITSTIDIHKMKPTGTSFLPEDTMERAKKSGNPVEKVKLEKDGTAAFIDVFEYARKIRNGEMTWEEIEKSDLDTVRSREFVIYFLLNILIVAIKKDMNRIYSVLDSAGFSFIVSLRRQFLIDNLYYRRASHSFL